MKKIYILLTLLFIELVSVQAQYVIKSQEELNDLKKLPLEKVYLSTSEKLVFAGEYLYYGFYCFNAQNSRFSTISKVGYVALVNAEKSYVFEQKLRLDKGLGQGEFFVPTSLPSGNYKLLGYTQWMKNGGLEQAFQLDVVIINPYTADQSSLLDSTPVSTVVPTEAISSEVDSATVGLVFSGKSLGKREKVSFSLKNYKGYLGNGVYTIKVKKKEDFQGTPTTNASVFSKRYLNVGKQLDLKVGDSLFLPEQRGELFFGSVTDAETNEPMSNQPVMVSLPGKEFVLKFATTDNNGNFYTYLRKDYKEAMAIVQAENDEDRLSIAVKTPSPLDVTDLTFGDFTMTAEMDEAIKQRSIRNQVENQFFAQKPDSVLLGDPIDPFDGGSPQVFQLDDYTRFSTFQETLVEILNNAGYRNNPKGNDYIRIAQDFEKANEAYNDFPAIVVIDGVMIPNHETIKDFDARTIKTIKMIRDQFQLANKDYQGLLSVETFDGNYFELHQRPNAIAAQVVKPLPAKNYYKQIYSPGAKDYERIPDYRTLLFWQPFVVVDGAGSDFEFFTSDVAGDYEVVVDGFTTYGKPIHFSKGFRVN